MRPDDSSRLIQPRRAPAMAMRAGGSAFWMLGLAGALLLGSGTGHGAEAPAGHKACADAQTRLQAPDTPTGEAPAPKMPNTTGSASGDLSDKLARSDGVLCPPEVGPEMRTPPPGGGVMPVIPPPGSPGGDPTVRPK